MVFEESITSPCRGRFAPTAAILFPWISTSPWAKLPTLGSMLTTVPPFSRMRRFGADIREVANAAPDRMKLRREGAGMDLSIGNLEAMLSRVGRRKSRLVGSQSCLGCHRTDLSLRCGQTIAFRGLS